MENRPDVDFEDMCPVCGDKVSGYHYGLLTCESCKGFFKRTVQNNKKYTCAEQQNCRIDKVQRKRCPFCRFHKCLHVGMRLEAVRADRMRGGRNKFGPMYKRDRALKQQRRALTPAGGFRREAGSHFTFAGDLQPDPTFQSGPQFLWTLPPRAVQHQGGLLPRCRARADTACVIPAVPALVTQILSCDPDELQLQDKLATRVLQERTAWSQRGRSPSTCSLMLLLTDQMLLVMVDWARTSFFFKQLNVSDQMKLLHHSWSQLLLLDVVSRQVLYGTEGRLLLATGQEVDLSEVTSHAGPALVSLIHKGQKLMEKLHMLNVDRQELACIKFLLLFNPDVAELEDHWLVASVQEQVEGALLEYTLCTHAQRLGRFAHLLLCLPELRSLGLLAEDYLCCKHLSAEVPCNSLLTEMLHARHSCP